MKTVNLKNVILNINIKEESEFDALGMATTTFSDEKVLSFLSSEKYLSSVMENKNISTIITTQDLNERHHLSDRYGVILSNNPKEYFYEIHNKLYEIDFYWKRFRNDISENASISDRAVIDDHSVKIGSNAVIEPGVIIHSGTIIGDNVIIRSGSIIGSNGFQFLNTGDKVISVKSAGRVIIKNNVEIQHNSCIDRGIFGGNTILSEYVKIDDLVYIGHDDAIGPRTFVTGGAVLGGRVTIGSDCWIGLNATISNGIQIGNNSKVSLGAVVTKNVPADSTVSGNFAIDHSKFIDFIKSIR